MREKYGRICAHCGKLYNYTKIPDYCECCGHRLVYKYIDEMGIKIFEPIAIPVTYHHKWWGKLVITPLENWAKSYEEAIKNE